jgi:hypothetical protein
VQPLVQRARPADASPHSASHHAAAAPPGRLIEADDAVTNASSTDRPPMSTHHASSGRDLSLHRTRPPGGSQPHGAPFGIGPDESLPAVVLSPCRDQSVPVEA